jgi:hypothetical protein
MLFRLSTFLCCGLAIPALAEGADLFHGLLVFSANVGGTWKLYSWNGSSEPTRLTGSVAQVVTIYSCIYMGDTCITG